VPEAKTDAALIGEIANGDRDALGVLVQRYWAPMFRYAEHTSHNASAAEDALQDTFLAVLEHAHTFRGEGSARAWLYTLARNAVRKRFRKRADAPHEDDTETIESLGTAAGFGGDFGFLSSLEDREEIHRTLAMLSEEDREILAVVDAEGLSIEEASEAMALSVAAVKSRLHRARLRFMAAMRGVAAQGMAASQAHGAER
jgi:RNA polymerase sigma-70 factor (ECF subfamily)